MTTETEKQRAQDDLNRGFNNLNHALDKAETDKERNNIERAMAHITMALDALKGLM